MRWPERLLPGRVSAWLRARDPRLAATRRAARTALVMPALFALCNQVFHSPAMASYAAFGSFSMLLLVDFGGPMVERLRAQAGLGLAWAVLICLGTLAAQHTWTAVVGTMAVAFLVLFSGVVSSVLAGASTALLLAFVLPVSAPAAVSQLPERLAGAGLATAAALPAIALLWPLSGTDPLSGPAARMCRAASDRLRTEAALLAGGSGAPDRSACLAAAERTARAATDLRRAFGATPYRPTGLSTTSRALVRLVDELTWLCDILADRPVYTDTPPACDPAARTVRRSAAAVLDRTAELLDDLRGDQGPLHAAAADLRAALADLEAGATTRLPAGPPPTGADGLALTEVHAYLAALDPSFRAQELAFAVLQVAGNVERAGSAERRSWPERLLGREPGAVTMPLASARQRAAAHLQPHSVWLHNSLRGAVGLGVGVLLANVTSAQHSFWVLLGTLSVLRSNALNTGQNAARAVLGTVIGSVLGAALLQLLGHHGTVLWFLLPLAVLLAGIAPAAISFTAGQAAFTVTLAILFNINQAPDWHIVLLRVQDIGLGCAVSVLVALFFWPRGASAAIDRALADAYTASAGYLSAAVGHALGPGAAGTTEPGDDPERASRAAAAAARRLDDAFRSYLAERGAKRVPLAAMTTLVTGVVGLRLAADSVVSLWRRAETGRAADPRTGAHREVIGATAAVTGWYRGLAAGLEQRSPIPEPVAYRPAAEARLVESVRTDLTGRTGRPTAAAIRLIWTGDHVDVARRLQPGLATATRTHTDH
ncbi:FUSC family protein [Kitasatospora sp. NPDC049285]|uniref:FUSC family protein n=1 Tax=Kitasatospora sp. NPDC049285 TaxID=3157096 RepID=UPI0034489AAF